LLSNPLFAAFAPNPENHPPVIYKYRNWKDCHHRNLLIKNELYMASPGSLNDPFDCRIFENHIKYVNAQNQKKQFIEQSLNRNSKYLKDNNISKKDATKILSNRLKDTLHFQVRSEVEQQLNDNKHVGIACFAEKWNSI